MMTIKQQGGVFGRNPTFNEVDVETITGVSGVFTQDLGVGTSSPSAPFVASNNGAEGYEIAPATAVGGTIRAISFNRSTVSYIPFRQQASEHQFYNASAQIAKLTSTGNLEVNVGNLVIGTSGKGIDFSATAGTGTSELLDDYEEGNYTGTLTPSTSGSITVNSLANYMSYTKVGRVVNIHGFLEVGSVSSPVGTYVSLNLPFTIISLPDDGGRFGSACRVGSNLQAVYALNGASTARILVDASTIGAATQFWFSFSYMAA